MAPSSHPALLPRIVWRENRVYVRVHAVADTPQIRSGHGSSAQRRDGSDGHEVAGVDPLVGESDAAGSGDGVAQRDGPKVLDEQDRGRRPVGDGVGYVPDLVVGDEVTIGALGSTGFGTFDHGFLIAVAEPDEGTRDGAHLGGLLG